MITAEDCDDNPADDADTTDDIETDSSYGAIRTILIVMVLSMKMIQMQMVTE